MTAINYYDELESFIDEKNSAKVFAVHVELKEGTQVVSSPLPISFLTSMIVAIEQADAAHTALSIWDRLHKQLILVPHNNIVRILIRLG